MPLPIPNYDKLPIRCRTEEHFDFLFESQMERKVSKFLYHMVKTYYERMYKYVINAQLVCERVFDHSVAFCQLRFGYPMAESLSVQVDYRAEGVSCLFGETRASNQMASRTSNSTIVEERQKSLSQQPNNHHGGNYVAWTGLLLYQMQRNECRAGPLLPAGEGR